MHEVRFGTETAANAHIKDEIKDADVLRKERSKKKRETERLKSKKRRRKT